MVMTLLILVLAVRGGLFLGTILYSGTQALQNEKCSEEK